MVFSARDIELVASPASPDGPSIIAAVTSLASPVSAMAPGSRTFPKVVSESYFPLSLT